MFSKFFIHRPVFACVISIIITLAGLVSLRGLPIEEYPNLTPPQINVSASYPGADAQTIAETVAAPLEDALNGVEDMIYMQSTSSSAGTMRLSIYFKTGTSPQIAQVNVNNRVNLASKLLPDDVTRQGISVFERSDSILEVISFYDPSGQMDIIDLSNYLTINVVDEIKRVNGVGEAFIVGDKKYSMRVWIKPDLLNKYDITTADVINAISEQNTQYSVGKIGELPENSNSAYVFSIRTEGRLVKVSDFENIIIKSLPNGSALKLKDVANVELGSENYMSNNLINGHYMMPMLVFMQTDGNAIATADAVNKRIEELSKNFPGNLTYNVNYNTTDFVKVSMKEIFQTFIEALVLVLIIMYLFLGNLRSTIIPMIAIPVSIIGTFAGIYAVGFSVNLITLFAMILAIGIVVDDAIIVVENVERNLEENPDISVIEATEKAMEEIMAPIISIVLVLCAVFLPASFIEGFVGIIQRQFALTLVISVCISGLVALTLTPALCAKFLRRDMGKKPKISQWFNKIFDISTNIYAAGVAKILKHIIPSLIVVAILCFCTWRLFTMVPASLVPEEDKGVSIAVSQLPPASTITRTENVIKKQSDELLKNPLIDAVGAMMGYDLFAGGLRENATVIFLKFKDWSERKEKDQSSFAINKKYNILFSQDRNSTTFVLNPPPINGLSLTGGFELFAQNTTGKSFAEIEKDMKVVAAKANARGDLVRVRTTLDTNFPQYKLIVNTQKAKMLNVNIKNLYMTINTVLGQYYVNDFNFLGKTFKVNVKAAGEYRNSVDDLRAIFVKSNDGKSIPVNSLIKLENTLGPDTVNRFNGFPAAKIMGDPAEGYTSGQAIDAIAQVFKEEFPNEYTLGWSGTSYQEVQSSGKGATAFIFGLIFVYLILAAQYERWLMPAAVMTAVPFSVFGAILFTYLRGLTNDIYFQIGLILLIGLGAKNAILIVEFAMTEHKKGKNIIEASIAAARLRFRPIVMTSLAFAFGVLPMVISSGAGSASRHSLGTGVIGGMIAASTIAIFFVPLFFYLLETFNNWQAKLSRTKEIKRIRKIRREENA